MVKAFFENPGPIYPKVIVVTLIAVGVVLAVHLLLSLVGGKRPERPKWTWLSRLVYLGVVVSVGILGATAFYATLEHGAMHGWPLFIHLGGAGAFTGALALFALLWASKNRFGDGPSHDEWKHLFDDVSDAELPPQRFTEIAKLSYWIMLVSGLATLASMLVSMMPWYGTPDMLAWLDIHRYAGLVLVLATIAHFYFSFLTKIKRA